MKKWVKILSIIAGLGFVGLVYVWFFVYNKPHSQVKNVITTILMATILSKLITPEKYCN